MSSPANSAAPAPAVVAAAPVKAKELHPDTQVVTAVLHNSVVQKAQGIIDALVADIEGAGIKVIVVGVVCLIVGVVIGHVL